MIACPREARKRRRAKKDAGENRGMTHASTSHIRSADRPRSRRHGRYVRLLKSLARVELLILDDSRDVIGLLRE
jgi:hypothetical protein